MLRLRLPLRPGGRTCWPDRLRDLEAAGVIERPPAGQGGASTYALTSWGAELRGPIEGLIRWSTPLMARGTAGDGFRIEWLALALPVLLADRAAAGTVGIAVDGNVVQVAFFLAVVPGGEMALARPETSVPR